MTAAVASLVSAWWRCWRQERALRRWQRHRQRRHELRELRLEEANTPALMSALHDLAAAAFPTPSAAQVDLEELLDVYATLLIRRQRLIELSRRSRPFWLEARRAKAALSRGVLVSRVLQRREELTVRCSACIDVIDGQLDELDALIRLYCERALLRAANRD